MSLNFIKDFYLSVRNTLVWFVVYFLLQAVIWVALAILILVYPQALYVLAAVFFILIAIVSLYFACVVIKYTRKLKGLKDSVDSITGELFK